MAYAARHPERVTALVLAGSGGPMPDFLRYLPANVQSRLSTEGSAGWRTGRTARGPADPQQAGYEHFRAMARAYVCLEKHVELVLGASARALRPPHDVADAVDLLNTDYDLRRRWPRCGAGADRPGPPGHRRRDDRVRAAAAFPQAGCSGSSAAGIFLDRTAAAVLPRRARLSRARRNGLNHPSLPRCMQS